MVTGNTGGGRGTNQHKVRGVSKASDRAQRREADVRLSASSEDRWTKLLAEYPPSPGGDVNAIPEPSWDDLSAEVADIKPKGRPRAIARYMARESETLYNDARLEGMGFTMPEIVTLLQGGTVAGHTEGEEAQVAAMKKASDFMLMRLEEDVIYEPTQKLSDELHMFIAQPLGLKSTQFRGDQREQYEGPRVTLDRGERFRALNARLTPHVLDAGLARISRLNHPMLRAATWAAFATYQQFYLDGNKRTGRLTMNAVLMSHGYDAILIPDSAKAEYEDALVASYRTGDLTPHTRFLLNTYSDR